MVQPNPAADRFVHSTPWLAWVKTLPEELVRTRPILMLNYAQALFFIGKLEEGEFWLNQVEGLFNLETTTSENIAVPVGMEVVDQRQFRELPSAIAFTRAYLATSSGQISRAIQYSELVLKLALEDDIPKRFSAMSIKAFSNCVMGELDAAYETISYLIKKLRGLGRVSDANSATFFLADIKTIQGRLADASLLYESILPLLPKQEHNPHTIAFVHLGLSNLHREWGEYDLASQHLETSLEAIKQAPLQLCQYHIALAHANERQSLGDLEGTLEELDKAEQLYYRNIMPEYQTISALKARIWIKQGRLKDAQAWARKQKVSVEDALSFAREFDHITLARLLLAQYRNDGREGTLTQVNGFLERLNDAAKAGHRYGRLIEILILQALVHQAGRDKNKAMEFLQQALELAEPEAYVKIFINEGKPLELLLRAVQNRGNAADYVKKLLLGFESNSEHEKNHPRSLCADAIISLNDLLDEPLSKREMEILKLIAQGLSNKEISEKLFIALSSVKGHNQKIFAKLQVQRRTEAVARARELAMV